MNQYAIAFNRVSAKDPRGLESALEIQSSGMTIAVVTWLRQHNFPYRAAIARKEKDHTVVNVTTTPEAIAGLQKGLAANIAGVTMLKENIAPKP